MPELATSVIASIHKEQDIAVGNIVGSNIFNILAILGFSSLVSSESISVTVRILSFDLLIMAIAAFACLPIFISDHRIDRWEGIYFLILFITYIILTILYARGSSNIKPIYISLFVFLLPVCLITVIILSKYIRKYHIEKKILIESVLIHRMENSNN